MSLTIEDVFTALVRNQSMVLGDAADEVLREALVRHGIPVVDNVANLPPDVSLLDREDILTALTPSQGQWLRRLGVEPHIDSTNSQLVARAARESIDGHVLMAEVQTGGRGRRGRSWVSPFARNLAMSIGLRSDRPGTEIGALSLVVGLAVADTLEEAGIVGIGLKWPNDVLIDGRKVCGILLELVAADAPVEIVVGVGLNVGGVDVVAGSVDQEVADVTEQLPHPSRSMLAASIIDRIVQYARGFETSGFAAFRDRWLVRNWHQGKPVTLVSPSERVEGECMGVSPTGGLIISTASGVREMVGGEISVRGAD